VSTEVSDEEIERLADKSLNGREIKNAVSCATSIVHAQNAPLTASVLKDVLEMLIDDVDEYAEESEKAAR
jgi:hypothetical protein